MIKWPGPDWNLHMYNSGMRSCTSKMTFAPNNFGTSAANTRKSGIVCTWISCTASEKTSN